MIDFGNVILNLFFYLVADAIGIALLYFMVRGIAYNINCIIEGR